MQTVYYWLAIMTTIATGHIIGYLPFVIIGFLAIAGVPIIAKIESRRMSK